MPLSTLLALLLANAVSASAGPLPAATAPFAAARARTFAVWNLNESSVTVTREGKDLSGLERERWLDRLAAALETAPRFLRAARVDDIWLKEREEGYDGCYLGGGAIVVEATRSAPFDETLVHELSHAFSPRRDSVVQAFLKLRYEGLASNPAFAELQADAEAEEDREGTNRGRSYRLRRRVDAMRLPRRDAFDFHGITNEEEYFAVAVQLYHRHRADPSALKPFLSPAELDYLRRLFSDAP